MSYHHFARLIRRHDTSVDNWLAAINQNKPNYMEAFVETIHKADMVDVFSTINALDHQLRFMEMDREIVAERKGPQSPEYEAFLLSVKFLQHVMAMFAAAGFYPGDQRLPYASSF